MAYIINKQKKVHTVSSVCTLKYQGKLAKLD
jgi:hypothetical protein